ncbi:MAG: sulfite exporter TauE/SafE family protein [Methylomonas sp.]|jgi:sulfite exporter TauE/SafE
MNSPNAQNNARGLIGKSAAVLLSLLGIGLILWMDRWLIGHDDLPDFSGGVNIGLLLLMGFLTGFHCVGMCGPLVFGYTAKIAGAGHKSYATHLLYGLGKTLSYTVIGGLLGGFGGIVAFTPYTRGMVGIAAGMFMLLFGLHLLGVFQVLNHFQFRTPGFVMRFISQEYRKHSNPFAIGLLNGLMIICGPLQAMYVMAAGTGSWSDGAEILFFFGLGTLPLMLGFGFLTSLLSHNLTPKVLKFSGVIVMGLGAVMLNRGLAVTGTGVDFNSTVVRVSQLLSPTSESPCCDTAQTIRMTVTKRGYFPNHFILHKGVPVKWIIDAQELTQCNRVIVVPSYGLNIEMKPGVQAVEFTPDKAGLVAWSCWMGMIPGTFIVTEENAETSDKQRFIRWIRVHWEELLASFNE